MQETSWGQRQEKFSSTVVIVVAVGVKVHNFDAEREQKHFSFSHDPFFSSCQCALTTTVTARLTYKFPVSAIDFAQIKGSAFFST